MTRIAGLLLVACALAFFVRLDYAKGFAPEAVVEATDAQGYQQMALNLLAGHGFSLQSAPPYRQDALRTPLYPALLALWYALAGSAPQAAALAQALIDSLCALLTGLLGARVSGRRTGALAAFVYALAPGQWRAANALMVETVLALLVTLAALLFVRDLRRPSLPGALASGAVLGLAVLCKPNVLALPVLFAAGAAWALRARGLPWRSGARHAGVMLAAAAALLLPWVARNTIVFGTPLLSTAFQDNLARVTAPATLAEVQGEDVAPWTPRWEALYGGIVAQAERRYAWPPADAGTLDTRAYERRQAQIAEVALDVVRAHPLAAAASHVKGFARSWAPVEYQFWYEHLSGQPWSTVDTIPDATGRAVGLARQGDLAGAAALLVDARWNRLPALGRVLWYGWGLAAAAGLLLAALGAWKLARRDAPLAATLLAAILAVTFLPGPIAYERFRVPVAGLITVLEVAGLPALFAGRNDVADN